LSLRRFTALVANPGTSFQERRGGSDELGRLKELGGLGPANDGFAQEGGGPVIEGKHGSMEVASS